MVDTNRRFALKALGGTAAIASLPSLAIASGSMASSPTFDVNALNKKVVPINTNTELSIALSVDPVPTVVLSNHSEQTIVVRHVYPGIVHAGRNTFDINSIFSNNGEAIAAGETRYFAIEATYSTQAETAFPRHKYRTQPQRIVALRGTDKRGEVVNSTRSFFA